MMWTVHVYLETFSSAEHNRPRSQFKCSIDVMMKYKVCQSGKKNVQNELMLLNTDTVSTSDSVTTLHVM